MQPLHVNSSEINVDGFNKCLPTIYIYIYVIDRKGSLTLAYLRLEQEKKKGSITHLHYLSASCCAFSFIIYRNAFEDI